MVNTGYKQSVLGRIPSTWEVKPLREFVISHNSGIYKNKALYGTGDNIVGVSDLYSVSRVDGQSFSQVPLNVVEKRKYTLNLNDLIYGESSLVRSGIARTIYVSSKGAGTAFAWHTRRYSVDQGNINSRFLYYYLSGSCARKHMMDNSITTAITGINTVSYFACPVLKPPLSEQQTIASALSDADELIGSLEQLLTKKRQIKQGAMQELLTGKKRLPGFSGEWEVKKWGEVIKTCSSGATPYRGRPDFYKGTVKWISSGELNYNVIEDTIEHISEEALQKTNLKIHPVGTFLMAITGLEAAGTRGACGIVGSPATTNQSCMAIYPKDELITKFLFHYYVFKGNELALQFCQGTKQQSYTASIVKLLPINLPPTTEEQNAIADVLSDMDAGIEALEAKLTKARQIKQGAMQELLTGRIRLV